MMYDRAELYYILFNFFPKGNNLEILTNNKLFSNIIELSL